MYHVYCLNTNQLVLSTESKPIAHRCWLGLSKSGMRLKIVDETGGRTAPRPRSSDRTNIRTYGVGPNELWIVNRKTGKYVAYARGEAGEGRNSVIAAAMILMSTWTRSLEEARTTYLLTRARPQGRDCWEKSRHSFIPFGKYQGMPFWDVPVSALSRMHADLVYRDPMLADAIEKHLKTRPEYQHARWEEETGHVSATLGYEPSAGPLFTPSGSRDNCEVPFDWSDVPAEENQPMPESMMPPLFFDRDHCIYTPGETLSTPPDRPFRGFTRSYVNGTSV